MILARTTLVSAAVTGAVCLWMCARATAAPTEFFVATSGDDANPGTKAAPLASPEAARDAIRKLKAAGPLSEPVTVWIRGGIYRRSKAFALGKEDSGTKDAPIVYRAYEKETVRWAGGRTLEASWFKPLSDAAIRERLEAGVRDKVLRIDLKAHGITDYGEFGGQTGGLKLFCNGKRMPLARWPDEGWAEACSAKTVSLDEAAAEALTKEGKLGKKLAFRFEGDAPNRWRTLEDVWIRGYWQQEYHYDAWNPEAFDPERREITMAFNAYPHLKTWRRFHVVNVLEEIDAPGEWYLDRGRGVLYFLPPADFEQGPVLASMMTDTMIALGDTAHVTIRGLTLEVTRGSTAIHVGGGTHNLIAGCIIRQVGQAIVLGDGTENGVVGCDIYDLDAAGILVTGGDRKTLTPGKHYVVNNHIHHYARCLPTWRAGVRLKGVGHRVAHNRIHHAPQYAISYEGNDHVFEFNEMHDLCQDMSDVGVIGCGTDWTYRGNVIRYNFIHHIPERPYPGVVSVYFDNCACSAEVFGNVFYDMPKAVMIGGGRDYNIENNIFIKCAIPVYMDNRGLRWRTRWGHFRPGGPMYKPLEEFKHDQPPWSTRYPKLARMLDEMPQAPLGNMLERNLSVQSGWQDPEAVCRKTFKTHIDRKYMTITDNYVTDEDPGFVNAAEMNFQLKDDSIAYRKIPGFKKIPFEKIGLYQDEYRATWPVPRREP